MKMHRKWHKRTSPMITTKMGAGSHLLQCLVDRSERLVWFCKSLCTEMDWSAPLLWLLLGLGPAGSSSHPSWSSPVCCRIAAPHLLDKSLLDQSLWCSTIRAVIFCTSKLYFSDRMQYDQSITKWHTHTATTALWSVYHHEPWSSLLTSILAIIT